MQKQRRARIARLPQAVRLACTRLVPWTGVGRIGRLAELCSGRRRGKARERRGEHDDRPGRTRVV